MEFRILGPLAVHGDSGVIDVPGRKRRAVLAVLLLHANEPVSPERLAVALWGEDAPASAVKNVHVLISRLRKALGDDDLVETTPAGYRLHVEPGELDVDRFERLVTEGRRALAGGQAEEAGIVLREALNLWRGPPLADLEFEPFAQVEIARLEEQHQAAIEARVEADLAAGRHAELVAELRAMVAEYPARERLAGHLMLALYRCGRQSEALDAYREARSRLATEVGVEPGEELRALQDAILHHDPSLDLEAAELPHELEAAASTPLAGRDAQLAWLREQWEQARSGPGQVVALVGPDGMGKTRLAAELAVGAYADGGTVLYASGAGPARSVHEVVERSRTARRPLLLVLDDADHAGDDVLAAVGDVASGPAALVLVTAAVHELDGLKPGAVLFLDLDGLDSAAVAEIAALYTPAEAADVAPAEWLLGASAGVPARVHEAASNWAKQRVGAVAERAAAGRSRLRSMEDELAGGVVQLQTVREWREAAGDGEHVVCPFKGLASFEAADAPYFFGRERLVAELVARLVGAPLLGVVGPSGSGKSSVVRAGLLPALAGGVLPGSQDWPRRVIRPGEHPLHQLHDALDGIGDGPYVLAVDQFEETFTACRDETERSMFIAELVRDARDDPGGAVVVALRADFYGRCAAYPSLSRLLAANHVLVGPMQREELERAVACPAQRVGLTLEDGLVGAIVDDVENAPGALPLLSTALLELWQHRDGRRLRLASYERTGGVRGAVARLAEQAFNDLDANQQAVARRALLQLVEVDDEGAVERRRVAGDQLDAEAGPVLDVLADRRLVTISEGSVELAHEALLREWPRLRGWIEDNREGLRVERSVRVGAREWLRVRKDDGALFRGARLAEASDWSRAHPLPDLEAEFLRASLDRERRDRRARRRTRLIGAVALGVTLLVIGVVTALAIDQRRDSEREQNLETSRWLAQQSSNALDADPGLATRLALTALDTARTDEAGRALRESTAALRQRAVLRADSTDAWTVGFNPDGSRVVTGGSDGNVLLWDVATGGEVGRWEAGHEAVAAARYSSDGNSIALGFDDGTVAVTDASLGSPRVLLKAGSKLWGLALTRDGEQIAAAFKDGSVRLISVDGGAPDQVLGKHEGDALSVDVSADGSRVVSSGIDGTVRVWTADGSSRILHKGRGPEWDVALSPDGKTVLAAGNDGLVRRWDVVTGREGPRTDGGGAELFTVAISRDGQRFAAGGEDGLIRVWAVAGGPPTATVRGQASWVYDVAFGPTAERLASAGDDGTARVWQAAAQQIWHIPGGAGGIEFNRDGRMIATSGDDGVVRVWDAATGRPVNDLPGPPEAIVTAFSPVDDTLLIASEDSPEVRAWSVADDTATVVFRQPKGLGTVTARFDPRAERIVYADTEGRLAVRTVGSGEEITLRGGPADIYDAQFSADGERVAVTSAGGEGAVWRVDRPDRPERLLKGHRGDINSLDYGADGRLVTAGVDRTVRVWPAHGNRSLALMGHKRDATHAEFTVDQSKVLSISFDGSLRLWDSRTGVLLAVLEDGPTELHSLMVSSDGKIAILDDNDYLRVLRCEVCGTLNDVQGLARSRKPRQLDAEERQRYLDRTR